ncbi:hypothetical protein DdX_18827 [Ditylenchus destructor]|uniref:Uncharacterized protein n=1 Tax=Ditylenchus destructor TaxID=166010 RepID=A0AAD4QXY0_9BILA|nr:hypothetical protein DdX_18827 [Ditylenchus destructor]
MTDRRVDFTESESEDSSNDENDFRIFRFSDLNHKFFPAALCVSSAETIEIYEGILSAMHRPLYVLADGDAAITAAVKNSFAPPPRRLMCYPHMIRCVMIPVSLSYRHVILYAKLYCHDKVDLEATIRLKNGKGEETVYQQGDYFYDKESFKRGLPLLQGNNKGPNEKFVVVEITPDASVKAISRDCNHSIRATISISVIDRLTHTAGHPEKALKVYLGTCNFANSSCTGFEKYGLIKKKAPSTSQLPSPSAHMSTKIHFVLKGKFKCGSKVAKPKDNSCPHGRELRTTITLAKMDKKIKDPKTNEMIYTVDLGECDFMHQPVRFFRANFVWYQPFHSANILSISVLQSSDRQLHKEWADQLGFWFGTFASNYIFVAPVPTLFLTLDRCEETVYQQGDYFYDKESFKRGLPLLQGNNKGPNEKFVGVEITPDASIKAISRDCNHSIRATIPISVIDRLTHTEGHPERALKVYLGRCNFADSSCTGFEKYGLVKKKAPSTPQLPSPSAHMSTKIHFVLKGKFKCGSKVAKPKVILREDKLLDKKTEQLTVVQDFTPKAHTIECVSSVLCWSWSDSRGQHASGTIVSLTVTVREEKLEGGPIVDAILANVCSECDEELLPIEQVRIDISAADNSCPHGRELRTTITLAKMDKKIKDPKTNTMIYSVDLGECDFMQKPVRCTGMSRYYVKK